MYMLAAVKFFTSPSDDVPGLCVIRGADNVASVEKLEQGLYEITLANELVEDTLLTATYSLDNFVAYNSPAGLELSRCNQVGETNKLRLYFEGSHEGDLTVDVHIVGVPKTVEP